MLATRTNRITTALASISQFGISVV